MVLRHARAIRHDTREHDESFVPEPDAFIDHEAKSLLVVGADRARRDAIVELVGNGDVESVAVESSAEATEALDRSAFDCVVLVLEPQDHRMLEIIGGMRPRSERSCLPVLVYSEGGLSAEEQARLRQYGDHLVVKVVRSLERLLDESALFLHRIHERPPESKREALRRIAYDDAQLRGRKVMIVDDDVRNIFAITTVLEQYGLRVTYAENGVDALEKLQHDAEVELVLMDIMMPEMDGYEATRRIRSLPRLSHLPIIALTAKAMKGDRDKCIQAGASDYITKPIDPDRLISMLRVWLYER